MSLILSQHIRLRMPIVPVRMGGLLGGNAACGIKEAWSSSFVRRNSGLRRTLEVVTHRNGGDLFGVADLRPMAQSVPEDNALAKFPKAISVGIRLSDAIVDQHSPHEAIESSLYWHHVYRVVSPALDFLAQGIQRELQSNGYQAFPVPASMPYNRETLKGVFSHKLAAHLAGLGWIGKSCLLITPDFGPRVRLVTVLTDAPLETGVPLDRECGKCQACIVACPVRAFSGTEFQPADPVEARFDRQACSVYRRTHPCGVCVAKCPIGRHIQQATSSNIQR